MEETIETSAKPLISLEGVNIFQKNHQVLGDVSLKVEKGEFIFLIGKNGSGKSSFLKTLYAELKPKSGEGHVVDFDLQKIKKRRIPFLRRKIGIVFQDFQLLTDRSVRENLMFVLKATGWRDKQKMNDRIFEALSHVGLTEKLDKLPHELSGGEQQKVAIARALLNEPDIILADEPTGNLDPETSEEIMQILSSLSKEGKGVIMASHDYDLMKKFATKVLRFEEGRISEQAV
jgi:cell division transport system ATP-binding protein